MSVRKVASSRKAEVRKIKTFSETLRRLLLDAEDDLMEHGPIPLEELNTFHQASVILRLLIKPSDYDDTVRDLMTAFDSLQTDAELRASA